MTVLPYLLARLDAGAEQLFFDEARLIGELRERYRRIFPLSPGRGEVFLFRLARAEAPTVRRFGAAWTTCSPSCLSRMRRLANDHATRRRGSRLAQGRDEYVVNSSRFKEASGS
jgi:hypothetical protein